MNQISSYNKAVKEIKKTVLGGRHINRLSGKDSRMKAEVWLGIFSDKDVRMKTVLLGIGYARQTGRISGSQEMNLRSMSGKEWFSLICGIYANSYIKTQADVASYISGKPISWQ